MNRIVAKLVKLNDSVEESTILKIGGIEIEAFDAYGTFHPLHEGVNYIIELQLVNFDVSHPIVCEDEVSRADQVDKSFSYNLFGKVVGGRFCVGDIIFEDEYIRSLSNLEGKNIMYPVDRINVEFISEA